MFHFIVVLVCAVVYMFLPSWVQVLIATINTFVPDPIPFFDEIVLWAGGIGKIIFKLKRDGRIGTPFGTLVLQNQHFSWEKKGSASETVGNTCYADKRKFGAQRPKNEN